MTFTFTVAVTSLTEAVKVADVAPVGTVTLVGMLRIELLSDNVTTLPPFSAA